MPRRKQPAPDPPKRRARNSGSVGTRSSDGRSFAILPADMDPKRRPVYSASKGRPFGSEDDARRWLDGEVAQRRDPSPKAATLAEPLAGYLRRWWTNHEDEWPVRTAKAYRARLRMWIVVIGDVTLGALTHEVVRGGLAAMRRASWARHKQDGTPTTAPRPYSHRTIQQARDLLHQALNELVPDVLSHNPVDRVKLARFQAPDQPVWDAEQADAFLAHADEHEHDLALAARLILRRALRRGEVLSLQWPDVDERRRLLIVDETAGDRVGETGPTKTRKIREIPLSTELLAAFRAHRQRQVASGQSSPWVFPGLTANASYGALRSMVTRTIKATGLPYLTPKDMRATCATILLDQGFPLPRVKQLLGHANAATTGKFYDRVLASREARTERLGDEMDAAFERASSDARNSGPALFQDTSEG